VPRASTSWQQRPSWCETRRHRLRRPPDGLVRIIIWADGNHSTTRRMRSSSPRQSLTGVGQWRTDVRRTRCRGPRPGGHAHGRCGTGPRQPLLVISPWARKTSPENQHVTDQELVISLHRGLLAPRGTDCDGFLDATLANSSTNVRIRRPTTTTRSDHKTGATITDFPVLDDGTGEACFSGPTNADRVTRLIGPPTDPPMLRTPAGEKDRGQARLRVSCQASARPRRSSV